MDFNTQQVHRRGSSHRKLFSRTDGFSSVSFLKLQVLTHLAFSSYRLKRCDIEVLFFKLKSKHYNHKNKCFLWKTGHIHVEGNTGLSSYPYTELLERGGIQAGRCKAMPRCHTLCVNVLKERLYGSAHFLFSSFVSSGAESFQKWRWCFPVKYLRPKLSLMLKVSSWKVGHVSSTFLTSWGHPVCLVPEETHWGK